MKTEPKKQTAPTTGLPPGVTEDNKRTDDGRRWFVVDPAAMYPAVLEDMGVKGVELSLALTPRSEFGESEQDRQRLALRERLLEDARRKFTAALHAAIDNAPMGLHVQKNDDWRL